jgi:hypothetical protein
MPRLIILFAIGFILLFSLSGSFSWSRADNGEIKINFTGSSMSVRLEDAPLDLILAELKRQKGIWFNWNESLANETISIQFKDLSIEEGLSRILSHISHALIFDQNKQLSGMFIISNEGTNPKLIQDKRNYRKKAFPSQSTEDIRVDRSSIKNSDNPFSKAKSKVKPTEIVTEKPFSQIESQVVQISNAPLSEVSSSPQQSVSDFSPFPN